MNVFTDRNFENTMLTLDDSTFSRCYLGDGRLLFGGGDVARSSSPPPRARP